MFVLTADQHASRTSEDRVPAAIGALARLGGAALETPPRRNSGDEVQTVTADAGVALALVLHLLREQHWAVGIGVGSIETPVPRDVRAARGPALILARAAVERAKSSPSRVAVGAADGEAAGDAEAFLRLLSDVRDRRTPAGWEVADLLADGLTQREAAERLGITPAAVSLRAKAAGLRVEEQAVPAIERMLSRIRS